LVALYNATDGANWTNNTNWLSDRPIDEWYGVSCVSGRVNSLDLNNNNLTGNIPPEIGELTQLTWLDLGWNKLTGNIPPEIGKLTQLSNLYLSANKLTGNIPPEIGKLTQLSNLYLGVNNLTGNIPSEIGKLTQLYALQLSYNNLTGSIPEELANLSNLTTFDLRYNRLTGQIPARIVQHPKFDSLLVWGMVTQQEGYQLERVTSPIQMPNATLVNQDGDTIVAYTFFANHKLTVLLDWATWCPYSATFIPILKEMYDYYHDKGLGVLSFSTADNDRATVDDYRAKNNMLWDDFYMLSLPYPFNRIDLPRFEGIVPMVHIVNQKGEILFSDYLWDSESYTNKSRDTSVPQFIASILGEINPGDLYESTDFSKDGEVLTLQTKTVGKGVNFVIVGDGYVDKDMNAGGKYETVMREAMEHLFSVEPLKSYREYFNVYAVKAVSKNEGIGSPRQTVFSSEFGSGTAVGGNDALVATYAEKIPGIDLTQSPVLVVLNSPAYAGTCYMYADGASIAYCPRVGFDSELFSEDIHHELLGHGFGRLMDEYIYNNTPITPEYVAQFNDFRTIPNAGYNLTLDVNDLPWQHIIGKPGYEMVGTYEGGYFFSQGVWRSEENSCMNNNVPYFSAISRELMVKRILETAGEIYTWEKFVAKDKYEPYVPLRSDRRSSQPFVPLAPPVFVKGSIK